MPPPWERHLSEDDEQFYYYNPETGECLWETDLLEFLADDEFQNSNDDDAHGSGEYSNGEDVGREAVDYDDYDDGHVEPRDERYDPIDDEDAPPPPPPDEDIDGLDLMALANMNVAGSQASTSVYDGISDSSLSVVERSKLTMRAKQQKINSFQQSREREQLRAQTAIPVTTRKAQSMQRSVEDMLQWEEERRQRLHRTKATLRAQEDAEVTGRPMLTKKAEEVSKRWREGGHGDDGQSLAADGQASVVSSARSVQDRLYEYDERKKEKIERIQAERDAAIRSSAIPRINPMSNKILERKGGSYYGGEAASVAGTSLGGESHVSERLYALAQLKQQQSESMPSDAMGPGSFLAQGRLTQHDPSTGQRYFEPRLNPVSEAIATRRRQQLRHLKIEDVLHAQGEQYRQKLAEKGQRRWLQEEQKRKTSKVNALSAKIVEDKYIVSGETTQDRLARGIGTVRRRVLDTIDQPTFQPKISESSLEILASSGYRHLYFQQQQQQEAEAEAERRQRWHAAQELSFGGGHGYDYGDAGGGAVMVEAGQVTLDPRVSTAGGGGGGNSSGGSASGAAAGQPGNAVYQRSRLWEQQRQRRLERDRHEAERREREICSFRPKVSAASAQLAAKGDIATRHQRWQQERDARLQSERQRQSVDEVKDCTFVPRVPVPPKSVAQKVAATRVPLVAPSSPSRSVESSSGHSGGLSGHGSNHSQGHVSQLSQPHFGFEDFATPYTAFLPKSPTAAGHKATVAASSSSSTQSQSQSQSQSSVSAAASAAGGVRFRTKSASELLAIKAQANLASHSEDAQRDAEHGVYSAPPTATHRSSQGQGQGQPPASAASQFSFAEFPPSQLRYGASHHPPVAPPASAPLTAAQQHWQQYYPQNAQLRELDDDDGHGAVDYAADMTSLEQLAQLSLRQERQQFQQQQQHHHQHQQQQQQQPVSYGYNPRSHQQRPPPHMMYHHHEHDDAHSAAFDPEDML